MDHTFFESILDNMVDGIYILDDKGNYIFVNSTYVKLLNMPKSTLLEYNAHDFLKTRQIDLCVSDIVYQKKHQVVMFQNVYDTQSYGRQTIRQMIISTPILNSSGNVQNIIAIVRPLNILNALYEEASRSADIQTVAISSREVENDSSIIAESYAMRRILQLALIVADVDTTILITGESGTGKEVITQYIHRHSRRSSKPMIVINCAALPESLLEAELFGYEKGAFTGASNTGKKGLFEEADGGIIFLDEVNSLPLNLQGKLLRTIETKTLIRIGSTKTIDVDFRLIAATNEDLPALVESKKFRRDLYYRLNVIPIILPPLRERQEDIIPLANHFLNYFCELHDKYKVFSPYTLNKLVTYLWPGNVRELKNFVERAVVISFEEVIEIDNVASITGSNYPDISLNPIPSYGAEKKPLLIEGAYLELWDKGISLQGYTEACERQYLAYILDKYPNTYKAAEVLGTSQASIMRKKKKYNL